MVPRIVSAALIGFLAIVALLAGVETAHAKKPSAEAARWATLRIIDHGHHSRAIARVEMRERLLHLFEQADIDGNGVSQSDLDLAERMHLSRQRAQRVSELLRDDLDGDGRVTRAEIVQIHGKSARRSMMRSGVRIEPTAEQAAKLLEDIVARAMRADTNADGVIAWDEILAHANRTDPSTLPHTAPELIPLRLDGDGDGVVTRREFEVLINNAFDAADADRDGLLSREEHATLKVHAFDLRREERDAERARRDERVAEVEARRCGLPRLSLAGKVAFISAYKGEALSTVALGGDDEAVTVSRVVVEPGAGSLALVLASHQPTIWLVEGDVARISNVVAGGSVGDADRTPRVGVVGVPAAKVTIARSVKCLHYTGSGASLQPKRERALLAARLGRKPDFFFAGMGSATVRVPSGRLDKASAFPNTTAPRFNGTAREVWVMLLAHYPKGLVEIDPARVIAATKVLPFEVLPQEAGLVQLVESGALEITKATPARIRVKRQRRDGKPAIDTTARLFKIKRQITFPAGLSGTHAVTFVLPEGVPAPRGEPEHSRIVRTPQRTTFNLQ